LSGTTTLTDGVWYHFAVVRSGSTVKMYVNGNQETNTLTDSSTWDYNAPAIGSNPSDGGATVAQLAFGGNISNLRILNGTALYTANFTPPTTILSAVANTKLLLPMYSYNPFVDYTSNNITLTINGSVTTNTLTPTITGPKFSLSNTGIMTINGSGQFDEYTILNLFYSDGSSLTGWTIGAAAITIDSTVGNPINSFKSTGSSQYAYINPASITSFVGKTIQVDMRATGATPLIDFFFGCSAAGAGQMFRLECRAATASGFATTTNWTTWAAPASGATYTVNTWSTVKIQINSTAAGGMTYFINGTSVATGTFVDNGGYIGMQGDGGSGGNWDNIYVYNGIV
jgi:hypothetical protein